METVWNHNTGCEHYGKESREQVSMLTRAKAQLENGHNPNLSAFGILTDISKRWTGDEPRLPSRCHLLWETNLCLNYLQNAR